MKAVLPGRPESKPQALSTGLWESRRIIAYITGNAFAILSDYQTLLQTVYDDDESPLQAIAFDEATGKIATATNSSVRIYKPFGQEDDALKWTLQSSFEPFPRDNDTRTPISLSWGASEELLVGRLSLQVYQTSLATATCSWTKLLASPAQCARFSYDSAYIACFGSHDRLVKVFRRLSFGSDDVRFDFVYLQHPAPVTRIQWRRPHHVDQTIENVLYTFCADKVLRIWTRSESHGSQHLQLWGKVDLVSSIQGAPVADAGFATRWAFIVHGRDFSAATETALQEGTAGGRDADVGLQHVIAVANRNPEMCVVLDTSGRMSAWALENIGGRPSSSQHQQKHKTQQQREKTTRVFNAAHVVSAEFDFAGSLALGRADHIEAHSYCNKSGGHLHILLHDFRGRVNVYEANVAAMLDPSSSAPRLYLKGTWAGHSAPIQKIVRNFSGRAVFSRTKDGEGVVWRHTQDDGRDSTALSQQAMIPQQGHIHRICLLRKGRFVVFLHHEKISLWDCRPPHPRLLAECPYAVGGKPLCLLILPRQRAEEYTRAHIATVTSEKKGIVWELKLPHYSHYAPSAPGSPGLAKKSLPLSVNVNVNLNVNGNGNGNDCASIREFCRFELNGAGDLAYVLPVDPAGSSPIISGFLDVFARDVAVSYTHQGRVEFWTARVDQARSRVEWLSTSSTETGVAEPSLVSGSTMKKAVLVNSTRSAVTIWDVRGARLEYAQDVEGQNSIRDLDWTSTPDSQSILAVGFPYRVLFVSQMRFDYLNKGPAWAPIREISIRDVTPHPIGDSTWLGDGHLVIGAGNQLFVHDRQVDVSSPLVSSLRLPHSKDGTWDLFDVVQRLNGPLPVFHPQFLSQCMLAGKSVLVHRILMSLHKTLKFWVPGETIDDYLGMDMEEFYMPEAQLGIKPGSTEPESGGFFGRSVSSFDGSEETFDETISRLINEKLTKVALPQLSGHEQIQLVDIVECAGLVETQRRSMDENGARFMLFFRQHALRKGRTNEIHMSWREINWAYHSTSQDILVDFVSRQSHGSLLWEGARESGMFMWLTDNTALKKQFEIIARNEYTKSEIKNPVDCSLFYLALKKKTVLQGLWRMASGNREQAATQRLLANNFEDPKWRTAAMKNAYALMSKRRFAYAAAFFLLADHLQDAVNVCLNQLKDLQLAIAITRVYEGENGPVLRRLLEEEVLAIAAQEGNRWLASWAFWMLRRRDMAVRALITPVFALLETPYSPDIKSRLFLTDDPALVILYAQLRQKTLQTLRGASKVTPKVEWEFVLHNARLYDRMGCDLLGLDLVRNWEFLLPAPQAKPGLGGDIDPLKLLRRRSSLVVADMPMSPVSAMRAAAAAGGHSGPPPSVFEEPDASSLLDSFGF